MGFEIRGSILVGYDSESGVTDVEIPEGVTEINDFAVSDDDYVIRSVIIPESVLKIGRFAFANCRGLKSIRLPKNVKKVGRNAFSGCCSLEEILVDGDNAFYASVDGVLLTKDMKSIVMFPGGKSGDYVAPESVSRVCRRAFGRCVNLVSVTLPGRIESIEFDAFNRCRSLESVDMPNGVEKIEGYVFSDCKKLSRVTGITDDIEMSDTAFNNCPGMADADGFLIRNGVLQEYFGDRETVSIPEGTKEIRRYAFQLHGEIKTVIIPASVEKIGGGAFNGCAGLADPEGFVTVRGVLYSYHGDGGAIAIPGTVEEISDAVFEDRDYVESVVVPESVKRIAAGAFAECGGLKEVTFLSDDLALDEFRNAYFEEETVCFRAREGSTAQRYAQERGIRFVKI
ncbi:MAG: leucine-rich repeat protein [Clostridia bacterium]|nr:leucine-rich repeat protein [Clostridia bacterium]